MEDSLNLADQNLDCQTLLRATAVLAGTAEARISYGNSVRLSVCHNPVVYQAQMR